MAEQQPLSIPGSVPNNSNHRGKSGGRGSRKNRDERRRANSNVAAQKFIDHQETLLLQIESTHIAFKPSFGLYAGATVIGCRGFISFVRALLTRLKSIAHRPLALLLTDVNCAIYVKISLYVLFVRVCAAQDEFETVVPGMTLKGYVSITEKRLVAGFCRSIPKALAFALNTFGIIKVDDKSICPLLPPNVQIAAALQAASFDFIINFVQQFVHEPIPQLFHQAVEDLSDYLPSWNVTEDWTFDNATAQLWIAALPAEWTVFTEINAAARAQKLSSGDYDLLAPTGHIAQIIRMQGITPPNDQQGYYCIHQVSEQDIVRALAIRPGDDSSTHGNVDRFQVEFRLALIRGFDASASAQQAALLALAERSD